MLDNAECATFTRQSELHHTYQASTVLIHLDPEVGICALSDVWSRETLLACFYPTSTQNAGAVPREIITRAVSRQNFTTNYQSVGCRLPLTDFSRHVGR